MLYHLLYPLSAEVGFLRLFGFITFRAAYAGATSLIITVVLGPYVIRWLKRKGFVSGTREPTLHKKKSGTPLAGPLIIFSLILSSILWADIGDPYVWIMLYTVLAFALLGFIDDRKKVQRGKGTAGRYKFICGALIVVPIALYLTLFPKRPDITTLTTLLFIKNIFWNLGILYVPFVILVVLATANSVNITDGIDGLSCGLVGIGGIVFALIAYLSGHFRFANYLNILFIPGGGEVTVVLAALIGTTIGFLWFNAHPAQAFMGDTASLPIGGLIGVSAVIIKQEVLLLIVGGVFVLETLSVILQVLSYKIRKKRIFKMAPLHHHFELKGIPEHKLLIRFWITGILFAILAISTLKIR